MGFDQGNEPLNEALSSRLTRGTAGLGVAEPARRGRSRSQGSRRTSHFSNSWMTLLSPRRVIVDGGEHLGDTSDAGCVAAPVAARCASVSRKSLL